MASGVTTIRVASIIIFVSSICLITASFFRQNDLDAVAIDDSAGADPFVQLILDRAATCVAHSQSSAKEDLLEMIEAIQEEGFYIETGPTELRGKFMAVTRLLTQTLNQAFSRREVIEPIGISHGYCPPSSICVKSKPAPCMCLCTNKTAAQVAHEYLSAGGLFLVVYPREGLKLQPNARQEAYAANCKKFPSLVNWELTTEDYDAEMVGVTFMFQTNNGSPYGLSFKLRHAKEAHEEAEWGVWFGSLDSNAIVTDRIETVCHHLEVIGGPVL